MIIIFWLFLRFSAKAVMFIAFAIFFAQSGAAQTTVEISKEKNKPAQKRISSLPEVKQIDIVGLRSLLKPHGKPLLLNFWATWCDPCREEFPDLVKISDEFNGKVDFITISFDDLADLKTYVPKFLQEMNSKIPAYLLHTPDEGAAIMMVSKNWAGNLPMTILIDTGGIVSYERNGKIRPDILRENIRKLLWAEQSK